MTSTGLCKTIDIDLLSELTFFTSKRLLIRFNKRPDDAMMSLRDSTSTGSSSSFFCWSIISVTPMIPCIGVRSSCCIQDKVERRETKTPYFQCKTRNKEIVYRMKQTTHRKCHHRISHCLRKHCLLLSTFFGRFSGLFCRDIFQDHQKPFRSQVLVW